MYAILNNTGQITLPESIRQTLRLQPGDAVEIIVGAEGDVHLLPVTSSITKLKGMLPAPKRALTLEEMQNAIEQGAVHS